MKPAAKATRKTPAVKSTRATQTAATAAKRPAKPAPKPARPPESIERSKSAPLYQQVVQVLRDEILKGVYPVDTQLPTESELCERFGVSRHTVREALRQLRDDGLVSSRQGAGTTVVRPSSPEGYVHEVASINDLIAYAASIRYRVDRSEIIEADADVVAHVGGKLGQRWLRVEGFRYAEDQKVPVCWTLVYVHADYAGIARLIGRRPTAIWELIEDHYGERVGVVDQLLRARTVPDELAPTLQVNPGSTVIEVQRTYHTQKDKISQVSFNLYPAERFSFAIRLRRVRG